MSPLPDLSAFRHLTDRQKIASAACFLIAVVSFFVCSGLIRIVVCAVLFLLGLFFLLGGRSRRLDLDERISESLTQWMQGEESNAGIALRQAFRDQQEALARLQTEPDSARKTLERIAVVFDDYLVEAQAEVDRPEGLVASVTYHREFVRWQLALSGSQPDPRAVETIRDALEGFEDRFEPWRSLVSSAVALRLEAALATGDRPRAERDLKILDRSSPGNQSAGLLAHARRMVADAQWYEAGQVGSDEAAVLRRRALVHYHGWLQQLPSVGLAELVCVADKSALVGDHASVMELLGPALDQGGLLEGADRRTQLHANLLLGRARKQAGQFVAALRCYSVLMSVAGDDNPYLRDPAVLSELQDIEAMLEGDGHPSS